MRIMGAIPANFKTADGETAAYAFPPASSKVHPRRHSGESRNLIRRKANPPFALRAKEIPAFAGMAVFVFGRKFVYTSARPPDLRAN
ncbi:MAG: hypothetical protein ACR2QC_08350 [Gammaproteobacteria bacterium]